MAITRSDIFEHILHETKIKTELQDYLTKRGTLNKRGKPWLSIRQVACMCLLAPQDIRVTALAELVGVSQQAVGKLLRALEDEGLVIGTPGKADARENIYSLTPSGRELLKGMRE